MALGQWLEGEGKHAEAAEVYRALMDGELPSADRERAALGLARVHLRSKNPTAALAALHPLPDAASTVTERERLALGGQALLALDDPARAKRLLESALHGYHPDAIPAPWVGPAFANMGKAYLHDEDIAAAAQAYRQASILYALTGREDDAADCLQLALDLIKLQDQMEPRAK